MAEAGSKVRMLTVWVSELKTSMIRVNIAKAEEDSPWVAICLPTAFSMADITSEWNSIRKPHIDKTVNHPGTKAKRSEEELNRPKHL